MNLKTLYDLLCDENMKSMQHECVSCFYPKDPRSPVKDLIIASVSPHGMALTWTRPSEPSRCEIISYIVSYSFVDCTDPAQPLSSDKTEVIEPSAVLMGLQPNWDYTFVVYAFTSKGGGEGNSMSEEVMGTTSSAGTVIFLFRFCFVVLLFVFVCFL